VHDLVIDNARIADNVGGPARAGSLAIRDGRIAAVSADTGRAAGGSRLMQGAGLAS
jgi:N-acyl-D-aspartate/D-glutamate deacylase